MLCYKTPNETEEKEGRKEQREREKEEGREKLIHLREQPLVNTG